MQVLAPWQTGLVHLVPTDRAHRRVIDERRVCDAIAGLVSPQEMAAWSTRFSLLGDQRRLAVVLCVSRAGPISVRDLAVATGMADSAVSQALRLLRAGGVVTAERDGRVVRYRLADRDLEALVRRIAPSTVRRAAGS